VKPVIFHREAEAEMLAAIAYYNGQHDGLGDEFRDEVEEGAARISRTPRAFSPYGDEGLRKHVIRRFPYTIFYLELDDCIWIAAVAHQRRRPGYWASRTPE
jgi:toxin ParE1/3/4